MVTELETLQKLCNMLRADNIRSLVGIEEVKANEDMAMQVKNQLQMYYDTRIRDNNDWLHRCNLKMRTL